MAKKKLWRVAITVDALAYVDVEATTEDEAKALGMELIDPSTAELADPIEVVDVEEISKDSFNGHGK